MVRTFGTSWINQALNAVPDEEHARRGAMRGNELFRNSTCALVLGGQCYRDAGLVEDGEGTISINGDVRRRAEVGVSKDGHIRRWLAKAERPWGYQAGRPVLLLEVNRLTVIPSIEVLLCASAAVAVMTRERDGHEGVAKEESWLAYDLRASWCG